MSDLLLRGEVDARESLLNDLDEQIRSLRSDLQRAQQEFRSSLVKVERKAVITLLGILQTAMKDVAAGKFDLASVEVNESSSKWEIVKQRLQPRHQQAIDILLVQQPMTRKQLSSALKMNYTNCVNNIVAPLLRQGLLIDGVSGLVLKDLG